MRDTVKAYQYERNYINAMHRLERGGSLTSEEIVAIKSYVDGLLTAMELVRQAACYTNHLAGSEYSDQRGSVDGVLKAIERAHAHSQIAWDELRKKHGSDTPVPPEDQAYDRIEFRFSHARGEAVIADQNDVPLFLVLDALYDQYDRDAVIDALLYNTPYVIVPVKKSDDETEN